MSDSHPLRVPAAITALALLGLALSTYFGHTADVATTAAAVSAAAFIWGRLRGTLHPRAAKAYALITPLGIGLAAVLSSDNPAAVSLPAIVFGFTALRWAERHDEDDGGDA